MSAGRARYTRSAQARVALDIYTEQALDWNAFLPHRPVPKDDVQRPQQRRTESAAAPAQEPAAPVVRSLPDTWSTLTRLRRCTSHQHLRPSGQDGGDPSALGRAGDDHAHEARQRAAPGSGLIAVMPKVHHFSIAGQNLSGYTGAMRERATVCSEGRMAPEHLYQ